MTDLELAEEKAIFEILRALVRRCRILNSHASAKEMSKCAAIIAARRRGPEREGPIMAVEWYQGRSGKIRSAGLDWAARWIEDSSKGQGERVEEFARNMAMTIRAEAHGSVLSAAEAEGRKS